MFTHAQRWMFGLTVAASSLFAQFSPHATMDCHATVSDPTIDVVGLKELCDAFDTKRSRLVGNAPFSSGFIDFAPTPPLNGASGLLIDEPNQTLGVILPNFQTLVILPLDLSTGTASGSVQLTFSGQTANGQFTIDQIKKSFELTFPDPFNGVKQDLKGTYTLTPITTFLSSPQLTGADPIGTGNGEQLQFPSPDLVALGPFPVVFRRYYGSDLSLLGVNSALGINWHHNYDAHLYLNNGYASIVLPGGTNLYFKQSGGGYLPLTPLNYPAQLVATTNGYSFLDPSSNLIYGFNSAGALIRLEDRNGNGVDVTPGPNGPTLVSDGLGRTLTFTYTGSNLASVRDASGRTIQFTQDKNRQLTKVTDADGNVTTYTSAVLFLSSITSPRGNMVLSNAVYDSFARVTQQTDSLGRNTSVTYAATSTTVKDASGDSIIYQYATPSVLSGITDGLGNSVSLTRDSVLRPTSTTDRNGNKTALTYDSTSGYLSSITDRDGNTTRFTYTAQSQNSLTFYVLSKITYADGTSDNFTLDSKGNVLTSTDGAGRTAAFTYNSRGQALTITNSAGGITTYAYGNDGGLTSIKLPSGNTTTFAYDAQFRVKQVTFGDGSTRSFAYDNRDNPTKVTDELQQTSTAVYDDNGNPVSFTDPIGGQTSLTYDTEDNVTKATDPTGAAVTFAYDAAGYLTGSTNAAGESARLQYNAAKQITSVKDAAGKGSTITYDKEGFVTSTSDGLNRAVRFTRNKEGFVTRATTPAGENVDFTLDVLDRLLSVKDALGATTTISYDATGFVSGVIAPEGISAGYSRDALGLLKSITDPNGNTWSLTNDPQGRLTTARDPLGRASSYQYDKADLLSGGTTPEGSYTITRDAAGRATQRTFSDGTKISAKRDAKGRLTAANGVALSYDAIDRITSSNGIAITYTVTGRIASITYANGKTLTYTYTNRGLLNTIADWAGGKVTLAYDDSGQVTSMTRSNGVVTQYGYDANGRLAGIAETASGSVLATNVVHRDVSGRIVSIDTSGAAFGAPPPGAIQNSYDAASQVSSNTYDGLGRVTHDAFRSYAWDRASRLTSYAGADGSATAKYDDAGLRNSRTSSGITQDYVWNYATVLPTVAIVRSGGADVRYYVYTPGGNLLYSIEASNGARHFYHFDPSGSASVLTDDSGKATDTYSITPYGESVVHTGSTDNPFTWLGQFGAMQEGNTGLFYLRARYYDSATARFLSRDPLPSVSPLEINPYQYADDNPITRNDATGLKPNNSTVLNLVSGVANPLGTPQILQFSEGFPQAFKTRVERNAPAPGLNTVDLSYAPATPNPSAGSASTIPRFCDTSTSGAIRNVSICRTVLLFPFISNQQGFDTGIAIADTAHDPFGSTSQCGACSLTWYQSSATNPPSGPRTARPNPEGARLLRYVSEIAFSRLGYGYSPSSDPGENPATSYLEIALDPPPLPPAIRGGLEGVPHY